MRRSDSAAEHSRIVACILGIPIDLIDMADVVDSIATAKRIADRPFFISTVNLNYLCLSYRHAGFLESLQSSDLCTIDGIAISVVCRTLGIPSPNRAPGADMLLALSRSTNSDLQSLAVFLFGGTPDAAHNASQTLSRWPRVQCCGYASPGFLSVEELSTEHIISTVNSKHPDFLVVALGALKGQTWIMKNRGKLNAKIVSHLGATINFLAGTVRRAPSWAQKLGLEWLWRTLQEPQLASRYFLDGALFLRLLVTKVLPLRLWIAASGRRYGGLTLALQAHQSSTHHMIQLSGAARLKDCHLISTALAEAIRMSQTVTVDLKGLQFADVYAMGSFLVAFKSAADAGRQIFFVGARGNLKRGLYLNGLGQLLVP